MTFDDIELIYWDILRLKDIIRLIVKIIFSGVFDNEANNLC